MPVVAIQGPSCCGKTTLATALKESFPDYAFLHQDDFYLEEQQFDQISRMSLNGRDHIDFDHPTSLNEPALQAALQKVQQEYVGVIVEGTMLSELSEASKLIDIFVTIHTSAAICAQRRTARDYGTVQDPPGYFLKHSYPVCKSYCARLQQAATSASYEVWVVSGEQPIGQMLTSLERIVNKFNSTPSMRLVE
eukprot:TRINITY_DN12584_c1_g2_i1.p1 TRINITY_DN12584_c1_g2~~TRINITY_DN12584_c1_g2_i1.p1  ORF type:complete len:193 (+),score=10.28 TRINITY_DN12584_c1_g2_i1:82-660(+)